MSSSVRIDAPAKINLRLLVLAREASGYHQLETLFCGVDLADELTVELGGDEVTLDVAGDVDTGAIEDNLVVRAAHAFQDATGIAGGLRIRLDKRIPSAAGMGGGSSDAAATLRALNALFDRPLSNEALLNLARKLGSDVPFFLTGTPYALAWGRGERLLELPPLPRRSVLIAHPGVPMPTPDAFRRLAEVRGPDHTASAALLDAAALSRWSSLIPLACNDFELPALERIPELAETLDRMRSGGASIALLAGSGAAVFGVFEDARQLERVRADIDRAGLQSWHCATLQSWPEPRVQD